MSRKMAESLKMSLTGVHKTSIIDIERGRYPRVLCDWRISGETPRGAEDGNMPTVWAVIGKPGCLFVFSKQKGASRGSVERKGTR